MKNIFSFFIPKKILPFKNVLFDFYSGETIQYQCDRIVKSKKIDKNFPKFIN